MSRVLCQRHSDPAEMRYVPQQGGYMHPVTAPAVFRCDYCGREVLASSVAACESALEIVTLVAPSGQLRATTDPRRTRR